MSTFTGIRDRLIEGAVRTGANRVGIKLPAGERPAPAPATERLRTPAKAPMGEIAAFVQKYRVALALTAVLGVLLLVKMRR